MKIDKMKVHNICVICWGLKGDLFLRIALLEAIKNEMPWVSISAVVDENNVNVLKNHPDIKVLLTSGFTSKREKFINGDEPLMEELCQSLLNKPYNQKELAVAVRKALDGNENS